MSAENEGEMRKDKKSHGSAHIGRPERHLRIFVDRFWQEWQGRAFLLLISLTPPWRNLVEVRDRILSRVIFIPNPPMFIHLSACLSGLPVVITPNCVKEA